jgi:hypothetical protein
MYQSPIQLVKLPHPNCDWHCRWPNDLINDDVSCEFQNCLATDGRWLWRINRNSILSLLSTPPSFLTPFGYPNALNFIGDLGRGSVCQTILVLIFGRQHWFVDALGFFSLGLESTLPLPQLIRYVFFSFYSEEVKRLIAVRQSRSDGWVPLIHR